MKHRLSVAKGRRKRDRKRMKEKGLDPDRAAGRKAEKPASLGLANEEGYPHEGLADFADSGVDPATGTLQLRGFFQNPDQILIPGLFARVRMSIDKRENALLVTERAIGADQSGNYLLIVGSDNVVEKKQIRMGQLVDGLRVIEEGLEPGEDYFFQYLVDGLILIADPYSTLVLNNIDDPFIDEETFPDLA